jgi:hypothetical protein
VTRIRRRPEQGRVETFRLLAAESKSTVIRMSKIERDRDFDETRHGEQSDGHQKSAGPHPDKADQGKREQTVKHELPKDFGVSDSHKAPPRKQ